MSAGVVSTAFIVCDGCDERRNGTRFGESAMDLRAAAYADGWRFPSRVTANGSNSSNLHSDVCPACVPTWEARAAHRPRQKGLIRANG